MRLLEFRAVAVMACDDEMIPLKSRIETVADDADLEEVYNTERHDLSCWVPAFAGTTRGTDGPGSLCSAASDAHRPRSTTRASLAPGRGSTCSSPAWCRGRSFWMIWGSQTNHANPVPEG